MRLGNLVCALVLSAAACGKTPKAGETPEETVKAFESAIRELELGAAYDMLSKRSRDQLDAAFAGMRSMLASMPDEILDSQGLGDLKDMTARDMMEKAGDLARDANPAMLDQLKSLQLIVLDVRKYGNGRARVKVSAIMGGSEQEQSLPMVQEDGRWYIDSDDAMNGLNVPVMPAANIQAAMDACVGST